MTALNEGQKTSGVKRTESLESDIRLDHSLVEAVFEVSSRNNPSEGELLKGGVDEFPP